MSETIDATGLPESVINDIRQLVKTLIGQLETTKEELGSNKETPEEWAKRLTDWVQSHTKRAIEFDDSRESIYSGRGE
jgi:hypothetical protein